LTELLELAPIETLRRERAAGPLAVIVLQRQQLRTKPLGFDLGALFRPLLDRSADDITKHLPTDRRIGVQQPFDH